MTSNNIKKLRREQGLRQIDLAEACGTSQQQIQRIESEGQEPKLDLMLKIAVALQEPLPKVFPLAAKILHEGRKRLDPGQDIQEDEEIAEQLSAAGVDVDSRTWAFSFRLRTGLSRSYVISSNDRCRISDAMVNGAPRFVVFNSGDQVHAVNIGQIARCHFPFIINPNPPEDWFKYAAPDTSAPDEKDDGYLVVHYTNGEPERYDLLPDSANLGDADDEDDEDIEVNAQLQSLFAALGCEHEFVNFLQDNEDVVLRTSDIAMISAPLSWLNPELQDSEEEGDDELIEIARYQHDITVDYVERYVATLAEGGYPFSFVWQNGVDQQYRVEDATPYVDGFAAVTVKFPFTLFHGAKGAAQWAAMKPLMAKADRIIELTSHGLPEEEFEIGGHAWFFLFKVQADAAQLEQMIANLKANSDD